MTIQEFSNTRFGAQMFVMYHGKRRAIGSVNFEEHLIGLVSLYEFDPNDPEDQEPDFDWVRCENCELYPIAGR